jgi:hypothetical protein
VSWEIVYAKQAQKDAKKLVASGLKAKSGRVVTDHSRQSLSESTVI